MEDNNAETHTEPHKISRGQFLKVLGAGAIVLTLGGMGGFASVRRIFASTAVSSNGVSASHQIAKAGSESASIKGSPSPFNEELAAKAGSESASFKFSSTPLNEELAAKADSVSASSRFPKSTTTDNKNP